MKAPLVFVVVVEAGGPLRSEILAAVREAMTHRFNASLVGLAVPPVSNVLKFSLHACPCAQALVETVHREGQWGGGKEGPGEEAAEGP